ncbi:hypothetical protein RUM44_007308 [Polyplax serrata]|uniref:Uncharacterized protein n=1 Tax=Polyplax serrata TaxID=468196 RepID=A0ABR1B129_POLSC
MSGMGECEKLPVLGVGGRLPPATSQHPGMLENSFPANGSPVDLAGGDSRAWHGYPVDGRLTSMPPEVARGHHSSLEVKS